MKLLDLFCGAGGAAMGYSRAGFDVTGVDNRPQPRYPFAFIQADALEYVAAHGHEYDLIHASPPCQQYTPLRAVHGRSYPNLVAGVRDALIESGRPWIIENVPGAPLRYGVQLCGGMFGLRVYRHRRFETSMLIMQPQHPRHLIRAGGHRDQRQRKKHYEAGGFATITGHGGAHYGGAMGIDWMNQESLSQAIPPAYTEWLARQLNGHTL